MDISLIIPSRSAQPGDDALLWATIASARSDLERSGLRFEILPVINGPQPLIAPLLHQAGLARCIFSGDDSPQAARHTGALAAKGHLLFFADAHCIFPPGFFRQVYDDLYAFGADLMHTAHRFIGKTFYGFRTAWQQDLWAYDAIIDAPADGMPFRICQAGHGAFAIRRETYFRIGGYWQALKGFGGEEPQLNFKLWMMGGEAWLTPRTFHWHWLPPQGRRGMEMYRDRNFVRNFLLVAWTYGGQAWMEQVYLSFVKFHWQFERLHADLLDAVPADAEAQAERAFIEQHATFKNLDALRTMFAERKVVD